MIKIFQRDKHQQWSIGNIGYWDPIVGKYRLTKPILQNRIWGNFVQVSMFHLRTLTPEMSVQIPVGVYYTTSFLSRIKLH